MDTVTAASIYTTLGIGVDAFLYKLALHRKEREEKLTIGNESSSVGKGLAVLPSAIFVDIKRVER